MSSARRLPWRSTCARRVTDGPSAEIGSLNLGAAKRLEVIAARASLVEVWAFLVTASHEEPNLASRLLPAD